MQIFNSFGKAQPGMGDIGAIYGFSEPLANACRAPGRWQVYDILYRAPRRDDNGEMVQDGSITAFLNGVQVQQNATFGEPRSKYHPYRYGTTPYLKEIWKRQKTTGVGVSRRPMRTDPFRQLGCCVVSMESLNFPAPRT